MATTKDTEVQINGGKNNVYESTLLNIVKQSKNKSQNAILTFPCSTSVLLEKRTKG